MNKKCGSIRTLKPDIVIVDENNKTAVIYELTVPFERNIDKEHKYKLNKYAHLETDITQYNTQVIAFEVGFRGGLTTENTRRLGDMHTHFMKKNIKKRHFVNNVKSLSIMSSYYIFTARKHMNWEHTTYIPPSLN